jgi:hypothetical protein
VLRVDPTGGAVRRLDLPPDTTLVGIESLVAAPDGTLLAIQAGTNPCRVLRIETDAAASQVLRVEVLESGHPTMAAPSSGCLATGGAFFFIGNPGWNRFSAGDGGPAAGRPVAIFRTGSAAP